MIPVYQIRLSQRWRYLSLKTPVGARPGEIEMICTVVEQGGEMAAIGEEADDETERDGKDDIVHVMVLFNSTRRSSVTSVVKSPFTFGNGLHILCQ